MLVAPGAAITAREDRRVSRSGLVLRQTELDELPQLCEVLRGAMSLEGPWPQRPRHVALYRDELRD